MDRIGRDPRPPRAQCRGPVALMHVAIDDQHPRDRPLLDQPHRRDREVVEHAEPRPGIGQRMMAPARRIRREAVLQRQPRRQIRPARHHLRPSCDLLVDRKADPPLLHPRHRRGQHLTDIFRFVAPLDPRARHRLGLAPVQRRPALAQQVADQPVLVPLIRRPRWRGRDIVRVVDDDDGRMRHAKPLSRSP